MHTTVFWIFLSFCFCSTVDSAGKRSSSIRSDDYTKPLCDPDGFYCGDSLPVYYSCPSRTDRCTTDDDSSDCTSKYYEHCDYDQASGKFTIKVYEDSTLQYVSSFQWVLTVEHRFVTYRGLMYEYDEDYGARVQDPSDPFYEYNTKLTDTFTTNGSSTCTYEQVLPYLDYWNSGDYELFTNTSCQDFVVGLTTHLKRDCAYLSISSSGDGEPAEYFFSISEVDCSSGSASTNEKSLISLVAVIIVGLALR